MKFRRIRRQSNRLLGTHFKREIRPLSLKKNQKVPRKFSIFDHISHYPNNFRMFLLLWVSIDINNMKFVSKTFLQSDRDFSKNCLKWTKRCRNDFLFNHGVAFAALILYWYGVRIESLPSHQWWALDKFLNPSSLKKNGKQSGFFDFEKVILKHVGPCCKSGTVVCFWGFPKRAPIRKSELRFRRPTREIGKNMYLLFSQILAVSYN